MLIFLNSLQVLIFSDGVARKRKNPRLALRQQAIAKETALSYRRNSLTLRWEQFGLWLKLRIIFERWADAHLGEVSGDRKNRAGVPWSPGLFHSAPRYLEGGLDLDELQRENRRLATPPT